MCVGDNRLGHNDLDCVARGGVEVAFDQPGGETFQPATHPQCTVDFVPKFSAPRVNGAAVTSSVATPASLPV